MSTKKNTPSPPPEALELKRNFKLRSSECDLNQKLKPDALFQILQEMAWDHAQLLGIGSQIHQKGFLWVLSAMEIRVHRRPGWRESIRIITRPLGLQGLFALRDFEVYDEDNQLLISASSSWLILDQNTRRPLRIERHFPDFPNAGPASTTYPGIPKKQEKPEEKEAKTLEKRTIRYSETDLYGHVNNASYVRFAQDAYMAKDEDCFREPFHFSIKYSGESFSGDLLRIASLPGNFIIGKKQEQLVFTAKLSKVIRPN